MWSFLANFLRVSAIEIAKTLQISEMGHADGWYFQQNHDPKHDVTHQIHYPLQSADLKPIIVSEMVLLTISRTLKTHFSRNGILFQYCMKTRLNAVLQSQGGLTKH